MQIPVFTKYFYISFLFLLYSGDSFAIESSSQAVVSVDTLLLLVGAALIFFMQAGFALLESGFVRSKNAINVIMKNYTDMSVGLIIFWLFGYGLMFGSNTSGFLGMSHFMPDIQDTDLVKLLYQMMFAATAATIISGAVAERMSFGSYILTSVFVTGLIYPVFGSWAWGGNKISGLGWLNDLGFIDFAGSTVVHSVGGWCALAAIIVLKPRIGRFSRKGEIRDIPGHNLTLVALGGFILWFGWFGFNGASISSSEQDIGLVLVNTQLSAAAAVVAALIIMKLSKQPILMTEVINGSLGGLVAITAGAATMSTSYALLTGLIAGGLVIGFNKVLKKLKIDDVVGAVSVHGVCGAWGTLAAGLFYTTDLFNINRILVQLIGIAAAFIWTFGMAYIIFKLIDIFIGLRASSINEQRGLDYTEHAEIGYPEFQKNLMHSSKKG